MATYKVIQDIEAEDKLVGPLTLRQFVYAFIAAISFYLAFLIASKGAPIIALFFVPIGAVTAFFAWPFASNQPTEIWALAKIRFLILPRRRVWDQSGVKELVTITVPKKVERHLTNGLTQSEVRSRLRALADTVDTRGWAIKNVNVNMLGQPALVGDDSDRLVGASTLPQPVIDNDIRDTDDMLDEQHNPVAQQFDTMMAASARAHRQEILNKMQAAAQPAPASTPVQAPVVTPPPQPTQPQPAAPPQNNYWFLNQPAQQTASIPQNTVTFNTQIVAPGAPTSALPVVAATPTQDEESFIRSHKNVPAFSPNMHGHLHVIQPLSAQAQQQASTTLTDDTASTASQTTADDSDDTKKDQNQPTPQVTRARETAILDLARNDDLNVATIAREAQKRQEPPQDEVVISLH